jgi:Tfp pilus assembly protein PilF
MKGEYLIDQSTKDNAVMGKNNYLVLFLVLFMTALVFSGSLNLGWTNWDDDLYVYKNPVVREGTLKEIFTTSGDYNMYVPLVIASFALEWKLVQDKSFLYHLDNLLLHLFCTALVLLFFRRLGLSVWWSGFAALLFGIQPMRVETVAWITERKELLCTFFYLASLLAYLRYIDSGKIRSMLFSILFFALSIFSKTVALTLPFILVLLDWYFQRKICPKVIFEKIFFFVVTVAIMLPQFIIFKKTNPPSTSPQAIMNAYNYLEQAVLGCYVYAIYMLKSVIPYTLSAMYPIPASLRAEHWAGAVIAVLVVGGALAGWRKYRFATFGLLFFSFNIGLLILVSFFLSDFAFLNDHYSYIAYIGLFFVIAMSLQRLTDEFSSVRIPVAGFAVGLLAVLSLVTVKYIPVWKNSETLWTHVIEKYPRQFASAYLNRGHYWYDNNRPDKALEDFNAAIDIKPAFPAAFKNRALIYLMENDLPKALQDYNRYLEFMLSCDNGDRNVDSRISDALGNRGLIYYRMGQYQKALGDLDMAIKLNPSNPTNYFNRASVYQKTGRIAEAKKDVKTIRQMGVVIDPAFEKLLKLNTK